MNRFSVFFAASLAAVTGMGAFAACRAATTVGPDGVPYGPSVAPPPQASADTWLVSTAADPRGSTDLVSLTKESTVLLADGSFAWLSEQSTDAGVSAAIAFAAIGRDGELHATLVNAEGPTTNCTLSLAGEGVVRVCHPTEDGPYAVRYASRQGSVDWGNAPGPPVISSSGETMAVAGRCDPSESDDGVTFCQYSRETQRWTEWRAERRAFLITQRDNRALLTEPTEAGPKLVLYDILQATRVPIETTDPTVELRAAALTAQDDRVLVLARRAVRVGTEIRTESLVGFARPGIPVTLRAIGMDAIDVAFADERRGMAIGNHADEIALTSDGGLSWTRVLPSGHPQPQSVSFVAENDRRFRQANNTELRSRRLFTAGTLVRCNVSVCVAGRMIHRWQTE